MLRILTKLLGTGGAAVSCLLMLGAPASAQSEPGVVYVSTLQGDPTVMRGDSNEVVAAGINAPMMVGDYLSTDSGSRAEVQIDWGHVVRIAPGSQIRFEQLSPYGNTVQLASGSVGVGVLHNTTDYTVVQTPSVTVEPDSVGFTRVYVNADNSTAISVRSGHAAILFPQGTEYLEAGSTMLVWGDPNNPSHRFVGPYGQDSFDQWNNQRNNQFQQSNAYQQTPTWIPGMYGLTGYGQWGTYAQYGNVWMPNVAAGWSPYSSGQWTYEPYYGWTWVDSSPWGYAPSHYGRWFWNQNRNRWAWSPGARNQAAQSWSPGVVAFIGFGGASVGVFANVGWIPLAPGEPMHRWWGSGNSNNATYNVTNVTNTYANARRPGSVRYTDASSLASGRGGSYSSVPPASLRSAAVAHSTLPVVPRDQALRYTSHVVAPSAIAHQPNPKSFNTFKTTPQTPQHFAQAVRSVPTVSHPVEVAGPQGQMAAPKQQHMATAPKPAPQQQRAVAPAPQQQHAVAPVPQQRAAAPQRQMAAPQQQRAVAPVPPQRVAAPQRQMAAPPTLRSRAAATRRRSATPGTATARCRSCAAATRSCPESASRAAPTSCSCAETTSCTEAETKSSTLEDDGMRRLYRTATNPSGFSGLPDYEIRRTKVYRTTTHPSGPSSVAQYDFLENKFVRTIAHPSGSPGLPEYVRRGSHIFRTTNHPLGPSTLPDYEIRS